ncbi:MAG: glycosyltransferase [Clostridia bacterium]|nr:glycosyltransferase [Clostridia bacterium]
MISVIVIGRNEGERLGACFASIRGALGVLSHEMLYVDSGSSDNSLAIAKDAGARCFLLSEPSPTAGLGRSIGAKEAKGEYLLFLDGDMQLQPGFTEKALMTIAARDCDGVTGIREDVYLRGGEEIGRNPNYFGCTAERVCPEFGGAVFLKAEALTRCGGWSGDTIACEEAELHARLLDAGCTILELPVPMIRHTDAVRDNRGLLSVFFSRRRLGEGQAMRCAMAQGKAAAYIRREKEKFLFYALDWLCVLLILLLGGLGFAGACFIQALQLGFLLARRRPRAFVSCKLFFFAFPAGLATYRVRSREYSAR